MSQQTLYPKSIQEVYAIFSQADEKNNVLLPVSSQTGTVISYHRYPGTLVSLVNLPEVITWDEQGDDKSGVIVTGPVSWQRLREFLKQHKRDCPVYPTENSASVLAGIATSCTGERSFAYGAYRDQVKWVEFMDYNTGKVERLFYDKPFRPERWNISSTDWEAASKHYKKYYYKYKNGPYPRLETETDWLFGSEGRHGIITAACLKTVPDINSDFYAFLLPDWKKDNERIDWSYHQALFQSLQHMRTHYPKGILAAEMVDARALKYVNVSHLNPDGDVVLIEVASHFRHGPNNFDSIELINLMITKMRDYDVDLSLEKVVSISEGDFLKIRMGVPRMVQEMNQRQHMTKIGTDAQFTSDKFQEAFKLYFELSHRAESLQCPWTLFGHFGDLHLHFNVLTPADCHQLKTQEDRHHFMIPFYQGVKKLGGSPFAEHGVGELKKGFFYLFSQDDYQKIFGR